MDDSKFFLLPSRKRIRRPSERPPELFGKEVQFGRGPGRKVQLAGRSRQHQSLAPKFDQIADLFRSDANLDELRHHPENILPDRPFVLRHNSEYVNYHPSILALQDHGLEVLVGGQFVVWEDPTRQSAHPSHSVGQWDIFGEVTKEAEVIVDDGNATEPCLVVMPTKDSLEELLRLWDSWNRESPDACENIERPEGLLDLVQIEPWKLSNRIPSYTIEWLQHEVESVNHSTFQVEVEMWYRKQREHRHLAESNLQEVIDAEGGTFIDRVTIDEISYHSALVELPIGRLRSIAERQPEGIGMCDSVMFIQPVSIAEMQSSQVSNQVTRIQLSSGVRFDNRPPIAAVFDGFPHRKHSSLWKRTIKFGPKRFRKRSGPKQRQHGTSMASLVLDGNGDTQNNYKSRNIFVCAVPLKGDRIHLEESQSTRSDLQLHRVVRDLIRGLKEERGLMAGVGDDVFLANMSIGARSTGKSFGISRFAMVVDFLSYFYNILFVVSAGNIMDKLEIPDPEDAMPFECLPDESRQEHIISALLNVSASRSLFSPAESLNAVTVGAQWHDAYRGPRLPSGFEPYVSVHLPNIYSAQGPGVNGILKPEILAPGGRCSALPEGQADLSVKVECGHNLAGILAAVSDTNSGNCKERCCGTSPATALVTHQAQRIYECLTVNGIRHVPAQELTRPEYRPVVVKALLVHSADWRTGGAVVCSALARPTSRAVDDALRTQAAQFLGYGAFDVDSLLTNAPNRVTLVRCGTFEKNTGRREYSVDLPHCLVGSRATATYVVTLAWISPIGFHITYEWVRLGVTVSFADKNATRLERLNMQPPNKVSELGTVYHARFRGRMVGQVSGPQTLDVTVSRKVHERLGEHAVRFAVVLTVEAADGVPLQVEMAKMLDGSKDDTWSKL